MLPMSNIVTYAFIVAVALLVVLAITLFYNKIPQKFRRALTTLLVFMFSAILFMNFFLNRVITNGAGEYLALWLIVFFVIFGFFIALSFIVTYRIADEEKQRKIFFWVSIFCFALAYINFTIDMINGFATNTASVYPAHSCRQVAYAFPVVYFMPKRAREFVLPFLCYAGIIGGGTTLTISRNIVGWFFSDWFFYDTVILHLLLVWLPVIMFKTREVHPKWWQLVHGAVGLGVVMLFAFLNNWLSYLQCGTWGNDMFFTDRFAGWLPTWVLIIGGFAVAAIIGIVIHYLPIYIKYLRQRRTN